VWSVSVRQMKSTEGTKGRKAAQRGMFRRFGHIFREKGGDSGKTEHFPVFALVNIGEYFFS
jgi:hypothetical protein